MSKPVPDRGASLAGLVLGTAEAAKHTLASVIHLGWLFCLLVVFGMSMLPASVLAASVAVTAYSATNDRSDGVLLSWTSNSNTGCTASVYVMRNGTTFLGNFAEVGSFLDVLPPALRGTSVSYVVTNTSSMCFGVEASSPAFTGLQLASAPSAPTSISATDGDFNDRVRVAWFAPDQSSLCSSISYDVLRDGSVVGSGLYPVLTGGGTYWDDTTAAAGTTYSYTVRASCTPGGQTATSASDTGYRLAGTAIGVNDVSATDGSYTDRVVVSWTAPNQVGRCTSVTYDVQRNSSSIASLNSVALSGGPTSYSDLSPGTGVNNYAIVAICFPGTVITTPGNSDTGFAASPPAVATSVLASDGAFTDRVRITWTAPNQGATCSAISYDVLRDGSAVGTSVYSVVGGGAASWDDTTAVPGTSYSYTVRASCTPGGLTSTSSADTGYRLGSPSAPSAVAASDGTFADRIRVTFTAPNQSSQCSSVSYDVLRNGTAVGLGVFSTLGGGAATWDDTSALVNTGYNYSVRVTCNPGGQQAASTSDPGFRAGTPSAATAVSATDGSFTDRVTVTWTAPNQSSQCTTVSYDVRRNGSTVGAGVYTTLTGGAASWNDTTASPSVSYTYSVLATCSPGSQTALSGTDTGYRAGSASAPTGVAATDGTFTDRVTVTFTAPDQSAQCSAIAYEVLRNGTLLGSSSFTTLNGRTLGGLIWRSERDRHTISEGAIG